jgi:hypothetical protein
MCVRCNFAKLISDASCVVLTAVMSRISVLLGCDWAAGFKDMPTFRGNL